MEESRRGIVEEESWERNHRRASWNRHHGKGIMGEESWEETSWERNHGRGIMERGIMGGVMGEESWEEESWERNHGRGIMGRGIMGRGIVIGDHIEVLGSSQEALRKLPRGSPDAPQRLPGGSQEAPRRLPRERHQRLPGGSQEAPRRLPRGSQGNQGSKRLLEVKRAIMTAYLQSFYQKFLLFVTFTRCF